MVTFPMMLTVCGNAGCVLKEHFCLPFRATLRKLRPEDMFETWVSTFGGTIVSSASFQQENAAQEL